MGQAARADAPKTSKGGGETARSTRRAEPRSETRRLLRLGWSWARVVCRAVRVSLRSASPGAEARIVGLLDRCGRAGLVGAAVAALLFPVAVAGVRIGTVAAERGRYLYYPPNWDAARRPMVAPVASAPVSPQEEFGVGGVSVPTLPLSIMSYTARKGDTLSGIASAFDLELDTIASLNRDWGNGVHVVSIGEKIRVPNQNGIYLTLKKPLEDACRDNDVLPDMVLAANGLRATDAKVGSTLFFPGVQHRGVEKELIAGTAFLYPVWGWISSGYGMRVVDAFAPGVWKPHYGVDIAAALGSVVRAAAAGTVWLVAEDGVYGKHVLIGHQFGYSTFYAHLDRTVVKPGQQVSSQTVIGYVGLTGRTTGPHLHFEIRSGGAPINPLARLAPRVR